MKLTITADELANYVSRQVDMFFPDGHCADLKGRRGLIDLALAKLEWCFKHSVSPRYCQNGEACFDHLMADQHCQFVWMLSQVVWKEQQDERLAAKLFGLNRAMHGFNCMYDTNLPDIFLLFHITGTVLGKSKYSDFLVVSQNCTVGIHQGVYPTLGRGVVLAAGASVIGDCHIGDRVSIGCNTTVFNKDVPNDSVAYRNEAGALVLQRSEPPFAQRFFNVSIDA
jgi:serine O-acetyltransferase